MKKTWFIILIFIYTAYNIYGQNICLKLDSIKITYIPLNIVDPIIFLDKYDIKNFNKDYINVCNIKDSLLILEEFSNINLENLVYIKDYMDARLIIEVFSSNKVVMTLLMDNKNQFSFDDGSNLLFENEEMLDWIESLSLENLIYYPENVPRIKR